MYHTASIPEKKAFIRWFMEHNVLKRKEGAWILNRVVSEDDLLKRVHFVEKANYCPVAFIISTIDSNGTPFLFQKGADFTIDGEEAFQKLMKLKNEEIYIQLNFLNTLQKEYILVVEENPYLPKEIKNVTREEDILLAQQIIEESLITFQIRRLEKAIDAALDQKDKEQFLLLSEELFALKKKSR